MLKLYMPLIKANAHISVFSSGQVQVTFDPFDRHKESALYPSAISDLMSPDDYTNVLKVYISHLILMGGG